MKLFLDWSLYKDAGMGDAYADIPNRVVIMLKPSPFVLVVTPSASGGFSIVNMLFQRFNEFNS